MIIGFSSTDRFLSRIIKWFTKSTTSHAYLLVNIAGEPIVIHASQYGVNCDHYSHFTKSKKIVKEFEVNMPSQQETKATAAALKLLDSPYDFLSLVGFAWVLMNRAVGRKTKHPFPNRSAYHCSEFALTVLRAAEVKGLESFDRELTSPEELMTFLSTSDKYEVAP